VFTLIRTEFDKCVPKIISIKGFTEKTWERKRPIWEGDKDKQPHQTKKIRSKQSTGAESVAGEDD